MPFDRDSLPLTTLLREKAPTIQQLPPARLNKILGHTILFSLHRPLTNDFLKRVFLSLPLGAFGAPSPYYAFDKKSVEALFSHRLITLWPV